MVQLPTWTALGPTLVLALTAVVLLLVDSIDPDTTNNELLAGVAGLGSLGAVVASAWYLVGGTGMPGENGELITLFGDQLIVDQMALFFSFLIASVLTLVVIASYDYMSEHRYQAEYYSLMLLAATGMTILGSANSLAVAFVALELASLPSYALVAILKTNKSSVEASLKYFLVGALSSGVFAYGISLVYGATGSLQFGAVASALSEGAPVGLLGMGILMIVGGVAFKTASSPFHFWAPEAYEGAPAPISAFLSSASKAAGFVLAFRVFVSAFPMDAVGTTIDWVLVFQVLAILTMFVGNFAAATQENVKRMLAYSSVGHAGYVLIGLAALTGDANSYVLGSGMAHLLVYGFMNTGAFLFIAMVEYWDVGRTFEDYNGLGTEAPLACAAMTIFLFSLAGLPIGGGFFSKFYLLSATVQTGTWLLAASLIINSALSLFYYSRVVKAMWIEDPASGLEIERYPLGLYTAVIVAALVTVLLIPGFGMVSETAETAATLL